MTSAAGQPAVDPRTIRATTEHMSVIMEATALFFVITQSGSEYTVDLQGPCCSCPDFQYRDAVDECKHIRRVRIEVGQVDLNMLENQLATAAEACDANAAELEQQAEQLATSAADLRNAINRLAEVKSQ